MSETESVLLLDDGELDDIRSLLEQMEVPFTHLRGEQIRDGLEPPRDLLISTPRRALAVQGLPGSESGPGLTTRIGVVDGNSATLRSMLRRNGFDFLLRRPFHPEIVRLLIIRTLFQGDEKRKEQRVPVGHEVSFKTGLWPRKATLADLSIRGCRLLCNRSVEARTRVTVVLPVAVTGSRSLTVPGRVLRSVPEPEDGKPEFFCVGVAFDPMSRGLKRRLTAVVAQRAQGAPALPDRPPSSLWDVAARRLSAAVPWGSSARNNEDTAPLARPAEPRTQPPAPRARPADSPDEEPCLELDTLAAPLSDSADEPNPFETVDLSPDAPVEAIPQTPFPPGPEPFPDPGSSDSQGIDRRQHYRGAFSKAITARGRGGSQVLLGRDLSVGGMRIESLPGISLGDRFQLALHGANRKGPLVIQASVVRDGGEAGLGLRFESVDAEQAEQLEKFVAQLPVVESLEDPEVEAILNVLCEVVPEPE